MSAPFSNPFLPLQSNASDLFTKILNRNSRKMACKDGCSKCCEAEFSVFAGEASLILQWFQDLPSEQKSHLKQYWSNPKPKPSCAFLFSGTCTIYQARPTICRTQGAPLCVNDEIKKTKSLTACDLNFDGGGAIPKSPEDWFDLNRLTELQSIAEQFFIRSGSLPDALKPLLDQEGRVPLKSLRAFLVSLA